MDKPKEIAAVATAIMSKPLAQFRLCDQCFILLEKKRQDVGIAGAASCFCPENQMHALWYLGQLTVQICWSRAEAEQLDEKYTAFLQQVQSLQANASSTGGGHRN
jgi:hypothetical protein